MTEKAQQLPQSAWSSTVSAQPKTRLRASKLALRGGDGCEPRSSRSGEAAGGAKGGEAVGSGSSREGHSHGSAAVAFISGTAFALPTTVRRAAADFMKLDIVVLAGVDGETEHELASADKDVSLPTDCSLSKF